MNRKTFFTVFAISLVLLFSMSCKTKPGGNVNAQATPSPSPTPGQLTGANSAQQEIAALQQQVREKDAEIERLKGLMAGGTAAQAPETPKTGSTSKAANAKETKCGDEDAIVLTYTSPARVNNEPVYEHTVGALRACFTKNSKMGICAALKNWYYEASGQRYRLADADWSCRK